jgi:NADH dehydrogenase FAD-containing subunit
VVEWDLSALPCDNLEIITGRVDSIWEDAKVVQLADGSRIDYDKLCVCTGAKPQVISLSHMTGETTYFLCHMPIVIAHSHAAYEPGS